MTQPSTGQPTPGQATAHQSPYPTGRVRDAIRRRRRGIRLVSPTGADVVSPAQLPTGAERAKAMLPSLFTLGNMMCGFISVLLSFDREFTAAAVLIAVAILLDIADGAVARAVGSITPFGLQFDSLADLISFGIGPAVLLHMWGFNGTGVWSWVVPLLWLACAAFRLARFNVTIDPLADKRYFIGLASPAAAGVVLASVFLFDPPFEGRWVALPLCVGVIPALLMISSYRFLSFRTLASPKGKGVYVTAGAIVLAIIGFAIIPAITGAIMAFGYVLVAPVGWATAPIRRRVFGAHTVAPPRHKQPSVFFQVADEDDDDDEDDEPEHDTDHQPARPTSQER
ncbi:CDP-diacylglycerol O-phosphatidyltransferase [Epidermidibacterium keratini]|uniref:CDP-diacylglycerol O-phosphatidyltransferase n=1 Tax=Epidermidibacterium keratini TaxID=1891644 RepID=A0A7L4YSA0_9ACTN|nr:phosphatidylcholine/phosphatidylserine synthase [Epidermidibacterium keratini]QHC01669.1 CDP-diacylglycerol O-phosphatidyltransferase [Epidermidibacterium keratini]